MTPDAIAHAARNLSDALVDLQVAATSADTVDTLRPIWRLLLDVERELLTINSVVGEKLVELENRQAVADVRVLGQ